MRETDSFIPWKIMVAEMGCGKKGGYVGGVVEEIGTDYTY
jgi:hypothetical protein